MSAHVGKASIQICVLAAGLALFASNGLVSAQPVSTEQILNALRPEPGSPRTRSLAAPADAGRRAEENKFLNDLRNRKTRSLSGGERAKVAAISKDRPSIDLEITFDVNSATLGREAIPNATALARALTHPDLAKGSFILAGHTDARGSDEYNQNLSERRAEELKRFLVEKHGIAADRLLSVGYGKTELKAPQNPLGRENRRVQVVNTSSN